MRYLKNYIFHNVTNNDINLLKNNTYEFSLLKLHDSIRFLSLLVIRHNLIVQLKIFGEFMKKIYLSRLNSCFNCVYIYIYIYKSSFLQKLLLHSIHREIFKSLKSKKNDSFRASDPLINQFKVHKFESKTNFNFNPGSWAIM